MLKHTKMYKLKHMYHINIIAILVIIAKTVEKSADIPNKN